MADVMVYRDYIARIEYSAEDGALVGRVINIRDSIGFHAESIAAIEREFRDAIDGYLEACVAEGQAPDRPFSGEFRLRLDPEVHRLAHDAAAISGASLNSYVAGLVERDARRVIDDACSPRRSA